MKIVIAPDSYKGSNTAIKVASQIEKGVLKVFPDAQTIKIPIADGGEGTVDALIESSGGTFKKAVVCGPLGEKVEAVYGILPDKTAVIEMAAASGLPLVPKHMRNPLVTTSYGTGQLIKAALDEGCKKIIIGLGGSATNDGGIGLAQALGVSFSDKGGNELSLGGGELSKLCCIDDTKIDARLSKCEITLACDVKNLLCGEKGAAAVYGPQKGATLEMVKILDKGLSVFADRIFEKYGIQVKEIEGMGAAGGLGVALVVFCGAKIKSGIETVLDAVNIDEKLKNCDLVITGEGRIDGQSIYGKVPVGVAAAAKRFDIPVLAIVGDIGVNASAVYDYGIDSIMSNVNRAMPLAEAIAESSELLVDAAERAMRMIKIGMNIGGKLNGI